MRRRQPSWKTLVQILHGKRLSAVQTSQMSHISSLTTLQEREGFASTDREIPLLLHGTAYPSPTGLWGHRAGVSVLPGGQALGSCVGLRY